MFFFQSSPKSQPNILNNLCGKFVANVFQKSPNLVTLGSVSGMSGFLKDIGNKFPTKVVQNIWQLFTGYYEKRHYLQKNFLGNLW